MTRTPLRIGQIVPSSNTTMETEIPAMLLARQGIRPERFTFHSSRMRMKKVVKEELEAMDRDSDRCVYEQRDAQGNRNGPRNGASGIADLFAERGDARIAREGEEQQARRLQDPADVAADVDPCDVRLARGPDRDDDCGQHAQHQRDDDPCQQCRLFNPGDVDWFFQGFLGIL